MSVAFVLFLISLLIFLIGLILLVISIILFKKKKLILAIISLISGLIIITPIIYMNSQFINSFRANNKSQSMENQFIMEYTKLDEEFSEIHNSNIDSPIGIYVGVEARINGKGKLLIIPEPYDEDRIIQIDIEGETNSGVSSRNWNTSKCKIHFSPESDFLEGKILLTIRIY